MGYRFQLITEDLGSFEELGDGVNDYANLRAKHSNLYHFLPGLIVSKMEIKNHQPLIKDIWELYKQNSDSSWYPFQIIVFADEGFSCNDRVDVTHLALYKDRIEERVGEFPLEGDNATWFYNDKDE